VAFYELLFGKYIQNYAEYHIQHQTSSICWKK
jgi:hypothetical protein